MVTVAGAPAVGRTGIGGGRGGPARRGGSAVDRTSKGERASTWTEPLALPPFGTRKEARAGGGGAATAVPAAGAARNRRTGCSFSGLTSVLFDAELTAELPAELTTEPAFDEAALLDALVG